LHRIITSLLDIVCSDFLLNQEKFVMFREVEQAALYIAGIMEHLCDIDLYLHTLSTYIEKRILFIKSLKQLSKL
jgi:hypothetical protein